MNKKLGPELGVWFISTLLVSFIAEPYFSEKMKSLVNKLQESSILSSFVVFVLISLLKVLYDRLRFASKFYNEVKQIDRSLNDCYSDFIKTDHRIISGVIGMLQSESGCDLLWETKDLALKNICKEKDCLSSWPFKNYFENISRIRRDRMISISLSLLNWNTNICLAVETHLKNVICNEQKFDADCSYRKGQISKLKMALILSKLGITKLDIRRIIIIKEDEWNYLYNNYLPKLIKYFRWHLNNKWRILLCINNINDKPLKLSSVCQHGSKIYNDFSDFVIIKKRYGNFVVFAQNSAERACIVYEKTEKRTEQQYIADLSYFNWFNKVWDKGIDGSNDEHNTFCKIDQSFISNELINKK